MGDKTNKRLAEDSLSNCSSSTMAAQPPIKKVHFEPHLIGPVSTLEDLDIKVLKFQNKKLAQRIEQRIRTEGELRNRIEQLEKRQTQDDAVLNVVNRYWNQLNEDVRILLQRFDAETADEVENKNENEVTTSFLTQLSSWDKEELDEKLAHRVQVSKRAVGKIVQVIDRLMQRNDKLTKALGGEVNEKNAEDKTEIKEIPTSIDEGLKQIHLEVMKENRNLQNLNTSLHEKFHTMSLKMKGFQDALTAKETENAELKNQIDELQYELERIHVRNDKLEHHLAEAIEKLRSYNEIHGDLCKASTARSASTTSVNSHHLEELQKDIEEYRELANNRLQELDKLHATHRETLKEVEQLKMDLRQLPESVIVETTEYKCLQSQFSVLYNESMQIKTMLDETRVQLQNSKKEHQRQIELMESEELATQKKIRAEMIQKEDKIQLLQREYESMRIDLDKTLAANEQTAPINREMRHLITSLQNHNGQLKGEVQRYKRKFKDTLMDNEKLHKDLEDASVKLEGKKNLANASEESKCFVKDENPGNNAKGSENTSSDIAINVKEENANCSLNEEENVLDRSSDMKDCTKQERSPGGTPNFEKKDSNTGQSNTNSASGFLKSEKDLKDLPKNKDVKVVESELVRELRAQLKKAYTDQKEMKLLLDMHKGVPKEQRDKVQLMAAEKKLRAELEELKQQLKKIQDSKRDERRKLVDEEALRKIKQLEEQKLELQKQVACQKSAEGAWGGGLSRPFVGSHEEEALLHEMEVTGQAYEDLEEQNTRLIQQLREKDDANFKLMSDRIKANQTHKLLCEQTALLQEQMATRDSQIESMHLVLRKLEDKERSLITHVGAIEKELVMRQQAMEMHKRKAIESAQSAADLKLHLEKYHAQMKEAQQVVAEKTSALEAEAYKTKRLQEELAQFKRKAERMKKMEMAGTTIDQVVLEEIREYKETLTCPSCKVKRKDAVLSKCFHVFCYDCLRTRYDTRQRKCPKCNCAFGANDYHRLYLT